MDWTLSCVGRKVSMFRFWNRLIRMDDDRLSLKILLWDIAQNKRCWAYEISQVLKDTPFYHFSKVRTYVLFKVNFCVEPYLRVFLIFIYFLKFIITESLSGV